MFNFFKAKKATAEVTEPTVSETKIKDIRPHWKALAADRKITKEDIAALCIYRAMFKEQVPEGAKTRLHRAFKPITNKVKLENGAYPYGSLESAMYSIKYSAFAKWLNEEEMKALLAAAKVTMNAGIK
jgi:hypothetical protein